MLPVLISLNQCMCKFNIRPSSCCFVWLAFFKVVGEHDNISGNVFTFQLCLRPFRDVIGVWMCSALGVFSEKCRKVSKNWVVWFDEFIVELIHSGSCVFMMQDGKLYPPSPLYKTVAAILCYICEKGHHKILGFDIRAPRSDLWWKSLNTRMSL